MATAISKETLFATQQTSRQAGELKAWIEEHRQGADVRGEIRLPGQLADLLERAMAILADGGQVVIGSIPGQLTTTVAAELIGVSRTTVLKMVADGELSHTKVGTHTRLDRDDVLAVRRARLEQKQQALQELIALENELGL